MASCWLIHTVKAKIHTYNITPIKRAVYEVLDELFKGVNISHLRVFGYCNKGIFGPIQNDDLKSPPITQRVGH